MSTRDIRSSGLGIEAACDVCGRTLLRGERAHPYLDRGEHRIVCELCTGRAQQEGWIREGTVPAYDNSELASDRRRSLLGRWRRRRETASGVESVSPLSEEPIWHPPAPHERSAPRPRESRHVRAIPTSAEHRIAFAIDAFNASGHPRTVAGVARSLGLPSVSVRPVPEHPSVVHVVIAWELCWYRYEFDLADEDAGVRLAEQGQELDELAESERLPNAVCDERGLLAPA